MSSTNCPHFQGGHQEDAEEFFGFYLDSLEEELLFILHSINPSRQGKAAATSVEEKEGAAPPEDNGWFEVGKRNRTVVTRTVCPLSCAGEIILVIFFLVVDKSRRVSNNEDFWRQIQIGSAGIWSKGFCYRGRLALVTTRYPGLSILSNIEEDVKLTHSLA